MSTAPCCSAATDFLRSGGSLLHSLLGAIPNDASGERPLYQRVRERPGVAGHSLPVVAMGSVPHIDRREGLSPGDPN